MKWPLAGQLCRSDLLTTRRQAASQPAHCGAITKGGGGGGGGTGVDGGGGGREVQRRFILN